MSELGQVFDPKAEHLIEECIRPHWSQAGAIVFITFRTADSIPKEVILRWEREKADWLARRRLVGHWSVVFPTLNETDREIFYDEFAHARDDCLDLCHGKCVLKQPSLATIVADSLFHFNGLRYRMGDFIVMPNHVHWLHLRVPSKCEFNSIRGCTIRRFESIEPSENAVSFGSMSHLITWFEVSRSTNSYVDILLITR